MSKNKKKRRIRNDDHAVVGVVITVLLIGLVVAVTVMINNVYVPQWLEEKEAAHMDQVSNQFAQLKYSLDVQTALEEPTAMSNFVTLGNEEIPIFGVGRTFGKLDIFSDVCDIRIQSNETGNSTINLGTIEYRSQNSYFVDQTYAYESGCLILSQYEADMILAKPTFIVTTYGENITFTMVNITSTIGKTSAAGFGTYPVHTEYQSSNMTVFTNVSNITVNSRYPNAWGIAFNSSLQGYLFSGFNYNLSYAEDQVILSFTNPIKNLSVKKVNIFAQIAPGWIEE